MYPSAAKIHTCQKGQLVAGSDVNELGKLKKAVGQSMEGN
jgi:hypothetical protein